MTEPTFAERCRSLREDLGLSRPKFAALIGCSPHAVKKWELAGKIPFRPYREAFERIERQHRKGHRP